MSGGDAAEMSGFSDQGEENAGVAEDDETEKKWWGVLKDRDRKGRTGLMGRTERDLLGRRGCFAQDAVRRNVEGWGLGGEGDRRSGGNGVRGGGMTGGKVVLRSSNGGGYGGLRRRQRRRRQESGTDEQ